MSGKKSIFLLICFFVDVRVHAKTLVGPEYRLDVSAGGVLEQTPAGWDLIRGDMLVHSEKDFRLKSPYAAVSCKQGCRAIVRRADDHLLLMNLSGDWVYQSTGSKDSLGLPVGLSVRLGEVESTTGRPPAEFPQGLPWTTTLHLWASLESRGTKEFHHDVTEFRPQWRESVEAASLQQAAAAEQSQTHEQNLAAKVSRQRSAEDRQNAELRALFAQKTFE